MKWSDAAHSLVHRHCKKWAAVIRSMHCAGWSRPCWSQHIWGCSLLCLSAHGAGCQADWGSLFCHRTRGGQAPAASAPSACPPTFPADPWVEQKGPWRGCIDLAPRNWYFVDAMAEKSQNGVANLLRRLDWLSRPFGYELKQQAAYNVVNLEDAVRTIRPLKHMYGHQIYYMSIRCAPAAWQDLAEVRKLFWWKQPWGVKSTDPTDSKASLSLSAEAASLSKLLLRGWLFWIAWRSLDSREIIFSNAADTPVSSDSLTGLSITYSTTASEDWGQWGEVGPIDLYPAHFQGLDDDSLVMTQQIQIGLQMRIGGLETACWCFSQSMPEICRWKSTLIMRPAAAALHLDRAPSWPGGSS